MIKKDKKKGVKDGKDVLDDPLFDVQPMNEVRQAGWDSDGEWTGDSKQKGSTK